MSDTHIPTVSPWRAYVEATDGLDAVRMREQRETL
jgi:hypothetical protein